MSDINVLITTPRAKLWSLEYAIGRTDQEQTPITCGLLIDLYDAIADSIGAVPWAAREAALAELLAAVRLEQ